MKVPSSHLAAALAVGCSLGCVVSTSAQQKVPAPTVPGTRLPSPGNLPTQSAGLGANPNNGPLQRGIFLTGRVQLDDGAPVSIEIRIEKLCDGRRQPLGFADAKGRFSVTLKTDPGTAASQADYDSSSSRLGSSPGTNSGALLAGCDLQAALPGYQSDSISLGTMRSLDDPNVGTIVLHRLGGPRGGGIVSASMLNAPKGALKDFDRGLDDLRKGNSASAEKNFRKSVAQYPPFASAWYELGMLSRADPAESRTDFEKAVEADPKFMPPYVELASMLDRQKEWRSAAAVTERALRADTAGFSEIFYYNAVAHFNLGALDEAEKRARETIKSDPAHRMVRAEMLLGYILEAKGQPSAALEEMKAFLALNPSKDDAAKVKTEIAKLEARADAMKN